MSELDEQDRYYDPMIFDIMRELANQVIGRYVVWNRETTGEAAQHWLDEMIRTRREVQAVDPDSRRAVEAKTAELREQFKAMPEHAPEIPHD